MKTSTRSDTVTIEKNKIISMFILFALSIAIIISGAFFIIYSLYYNISFKVINTYVSGVFFGLAVLYLGIRYFMSVQKLKKEVYKPSSRFSWNNFKKLQKNR